MVDSHFQKFLVYVTPIEKEIEDDPNLWVRGYYIGFHKNEDIQVASNHIKVAHDSGRDFQIVQQFL